MRMSERLPDKAWMAATLVAAAGMMSLGCGSKPDSGSSSKEGAPAVAQNVEKEGQAVERICQLVIDSDVLAPYYHADTDATRKPLYLAQSGLVGPDLHLMKFGEPVKIAPRAEIQAMGRPYLEITKLEIQGNQATVEFAYPVEGISGAATLERRDTGWAVQQDRLKEH